MSKDKYTFQTYCVKECKDSKSTKPHQLPLYATSSFEMNSVQDAIDVFKGNKFGHVYSRYGNPTIDGVAQKIADLEALGTEKDASALMTSSGMSAISTLLYALGSNGDVVLTQGNLYGGTTELLEKVISRHGIKTTFLNFRDLNGVEEYLNNHKVTFIYLETPANPTLDCVDLVKVQKLAERYGVITIIDNTFCTPYIQQPIKLGIDYVIHSSTKYLNGHGNSISGVIVGTDQEGMKKVWTTLKLMGGTCNAWDAWLLNNGLKTLGIRMDRQCENALFLAQELEKLDGIGRVNYPGLTSFSNHSIAASQMSKFGGMLSFEVGKTIDDAIRFIDNLSLCTHAPTLGDIDTLVLHPATSSHLNVDKSLCEEYGISDSLVRMSVGIENQYDLLRDIQEAIGLTF